MALQKKINVPMSTNLPVPNVNNKTGEAIKLNELVNKTNRSNDGQNQFTSATSGIKYSTLDYPDNPLIYNKGETGLYNILILLYGGDNGFLILADDYNNMVDAIELGGRQSNNAISIANSASQVANTTLSEVNKIKDGTIKVNRASNADYATNAGLAENATLAGNATQANKTIGSLNLKIEGQNEVIFNGGSNKSMNITRALLGAAKAYYSTETTPPSPTVGNDGDIFGVIE